MGEYVAVSANTVTKCSEVPTLKRFASSVLTVTFRTNQVFPESKSNLWAPHLPCGDTGLDKILRNYAGVILTLFGESHLGE